MYLFLRAGLELVRITQNRLFDTKT